MIPFIAWALLIWNVVYCVIKTVQDFSSPRPSRGCLGVFAVAGSLLLFAVLAFSVFALPGL